jgi:chemotaxis protein CheD
MGSIPPPAATRHHLNPCMLMAHAGELEISTLLGSCIAVCLWDSTRACGGMNHYMLPLWNGDGLPTPKFGNVAIEKLIERLLQFGCQKRNLVAKCFGGASLIADATGLMQIGARNIEIADELLGIHQIPIVAREVGGQQGMRVIFNTQSGVALVGRFAPQVVPLPNLGQKG